MAQKGYRRLMAAVVLLAVLGSVGYFIFRRSWGRPSSAEERLTVVTTLPLLAGLAERIGGPEVQVISIIQGGACAHGHEPTPREMAHLADAALFIKAGAGLDPWADDLLSGLGAKRPPVVDASYNVFGPGEESTGVHYWGNPEKAAGAAENILHGLIILRPTKEDFFRRNYRIFRAELERMATAFRAQAAGWRHKEVISYSAAFAPLLDYLGLVNLATVEASHEEEVSPRRLVEVISLARTRGIKVVVGETTAPRPAEVLAGEIGARVALLWPTGDPSGDYLHTLRENVKRLGEACR
ncbi:MAG: zinc ABC transporter substrate-binding protein [Firmicutes bacterium]|nr:zinc ABC transporter substrate-binding protein [Bacillota bacterium]